MSEFVEPWRRPTVASIRRQRGGGPARCLVVAACAVALCASTVAAQVRATYLYTLSNFGGRVPYDWTRVSVDLEREELYVIYQNVVRVFNASGMEVFSFGDDLDVGLIADLVVDRDGDIILLSYKEARALLTRCNFRGVPVGTFEIRNLPSEVDFHPSRMIYRNGLFYFVTMAEGTVVIADDSGEFRERIELLSMVDSEAQRKDGAEIFGLSVGADGSIFFTVAVLFKAYKLSSDRKLTSFGRPGSAPGRFGIVAGIAADSRGHVFVADRLKCAIMVFDKDFNFLTEFGYRGPRPENLIIPDDIVIDKRDRIYVTQAAKRGVSVFALTAG